MTDADTLARTLWGEARNQDEEGMVAVANVVMNRFAAWPHHSHFGTGTVASVCLAPWQFSCWNANDPNRAKLLAVTEADDTFALCVAIAEQAIQGELDDVTGGATYYKVIGTPAAWAEGHTPCFVFKDHEFFRGIA